MRLKRLLIREPYRALAKGEICFAPREGYSVMHQEIYGQLGISVLVGSNGSGKTTALSLVHLLFHHLEREPGRIPGNPVLEYEIQLDTDASVIAIDVFDGKVTICINGKKRILLPWNKRKREHPIPTDSTEIAFPEIVRFLPSSIVISGFSIHGEFPHHSSNYTGHDITKIYDTSLVYGRHHWSLPSLSKGIARMACLLSENQQIAQLFSDVLGITFAFHLLVRPREEPFAYLQRKAEEEERLDFEYDLLVDTGTQPRGGRQRWKDEQRRLRSDFKSEWKTFDKKLLHEEETGDVWFNDILLIRDGKKIFLGNMSSGEKMLFVRILSILSEYKRNSIIIIEEPELHLDLSWCRQIVTLLALLFGKERTHFLISTHNHSLINSVMPESIIRLQHGQSEKVTSPTLLGNHSSIENALFEDSTHQNIVERHVARMLGRGALNEVQALMGKMGESRLRFQVFRYLRRLEQEKKQD